MSTYFERFYYFLETTNPLTLLTTKEQVNEAKRIVSHDSPSSPEYKKARTLLDSVVHPDTGEPILAPFRFSAFVPMNLIILSGMLHPSQQTPMLGMFWQTLNQTYNVALNYSNRNASSNLTSLDLFKSYCLAVGVSCSLSFAGAKLAARSKSFALRLLVPYSAVACASVANVLAMRSAELTEGVSLQDANGKIVANGMKSQVAGYTGLAQVALSRIMFPIPFVICPPIILEGLKMSLLRSATAQTINLAYVTIITACLWIGTPACIAIFPQIGEIDVKNLEQPFQNLIDDKVGKPYTKLYYNKGL